MTAAEPKTMTATADEPTAGRVVRVTGPVVDVEFPRGAVPELFNALHAEITFAELAQDADPRGRPAPRRQPGAHHLDAAHRRPGPRRRGHRHRRADLGAGRRRRQGPRVQRARRLPRRARATARTSSTGAIHRKPPAFDQLEATHRDARDRPQGRRPAHPVRAWRQDRPVRRCRRRQDGAHPGDDQPYRPQLRWHLGVRRRRGAHP